MHIIVATCSVTYTGRGDTTLAPRRRAIMFKSDGSVSVHSDAGNKALNYMGVPNVATWETLDDGTISLTIDARNESLHIVIHHVHAEFDMPLDADEPGLVRDGTESHLQAWLAERPHLFGDDYHLVGREHRTNAGPVDILLRHADGHHLAVEVKRIATPNAVGQVRKYAEALADELDDVRACIAALDIRPRCTILAAKHSVRCLTIDPDWRAPLTQPDSGTGPR